MPKTNGCLVDLVRAISECGCPDCASVLRIVWSVIEFYEDHPGLMRLIRAALGMHPIDNE